MYDSIQIHSSQVHSFLDGLMHLEVTLQMNKFAQMTRQMNFSESGMYRKADNLSKRYYAAHRIIEVCLIQPAHSLNNMSRKDKDARQTQTTFCVM